MKYIDADGRRLLTGLLLSVFASPALSMLAWGAFIEMSGIAWPKFGYWEFFMLNIVLQIVRSGIPLKWNIKED